MTMPGVCFVISSFRPVVGGAELRTERLASGLAGRGMDVVVATRRYPGTAARETIAGVRVYRLGYPSRGKVGALTFALGTLWALATRLRRYAIVHVQSQDSPLLIGMSARILLSKTLIMTVRSDPVRVWKAMGRLRKWLFPHLVDVAAGLSSVMRDQLISAGLQTDRVVCLPSGIDTATYVPATAEERSRARHRLGLEEGTLVYLFAGRLETVKGLTTLIDAWGRSHHPGLRRKLLIVGEGSTGTDLRRLVSEKGLIDVSFEGESSDVIEYLRAADVFVLPSQWEGISNALLEAMAMGVPSIVSDVPGNRAVVSDGMAGLVFPVGDAEALSVRIRAMEDESLRKQMSISAREFIQQRFSLDRSIESHLDLYSGLYDVGTGDRKIPSNDRGVRSTARSVG